MPRWPDAPAWTALRDAVQPAVNALCDAISAEWSRPVVPPDVVTGTPGTLATHTPAGVALDPTLTGPHVVPPDHAPTVPALALDRWRLTIGALAEAAALAALHAHRGPSDGPLETAWRVGLAADAVDSADPALGWAWAPAVSLLQEPGIPLPQRPRAALWWARYTGHTGPDAPCPRPDAAAWTAFGRWLRDPAHGPAAALPTPVAPASIPWLTAFELAPWSHAFVERPLRPAGRPWTVDGPVHPTALDPQDAADTVVFGTLDGGRVQLTRATEGPLGTWRLDSGGMHGQVGSARGVTLRLQADGRASLTAADGFVGPATARLLEMADQYGVSGSADGRWRLTGLHGDRGTLRVSGLHTGAATVHGRGGLGFALPAEEWLAPVRHFLQMVEAVPLAWALSDGGHRLTVTAPDLGGLELRFSRER